LIVFEEGNDKRRAVEKKAQEEKGIERWNGSERRRKTGIK